MRPLLNGIINRVKLVGIELEGGWDAPVPGETIHKDSSVVFPPPRILTDPTTGIRSVDPTCVYPKHDIGEIASQDPMPVEEVEPWMMRCYPQHVNGTCGLHVHMSFHHKLNYSRLVVPEYTQFMVEAVKSFCINEGLPESHPQWSRVNQPDHRHCAHTFLGDKQIMMRKKDYNSRGTEHSRYTFINYCDGQYHTIECRGLAMYDTPAQGVRAVMCVLNATNRFLSKMRQRERAVVASVIERPPVYQEIGTIVR